jgi:calcium-dependent protein kinase
MPGASRMTENASAWLARTVGASAGLYDVYNVDADRVLGAGSFGRVFKGVNRVCGTACAIKQIRKGGHRGMVREEIDIMKHLDHPHTVRFIEWFEDDLNDYLVMELCAGGRLVRFLANMQNYSERDTAFLMQQLLSAVAHLHRNQILHRDVKPDNLLLESSRPLYDNKLKLGDFGLSCHCAHGRDVRLSAGTAEFISPQAIDGCYDTKTDMWSCGVTMYYLLCGFVPFRAPTEAGIFAAVKRGNFSFAAMEWKIVSAEATDMIRCLLKMNPNERWSAQDAMNHVWVLQRAPGAYGPLYKTVANFNACGTQDKRPQQEADVFANMQSVLQDVTQWANALLPKNKWQCTSAPNEQYEVILSEFH